ncbi:ATP-dependent helicase HrpB [Synechococcus sp. CCY9202]|uniref:ATP-dependent helicase HrpB n=1 Tax=Synechococcus sp. CCY9202 TaxID=174698 RepID=UPI002B20B455|nr:ATP-dependent helicase HrpB [Synechococcus sp. CCY9202]MEA5421965.1 ATP-dependent helicase HrpB [Synechococcus sp. CCY9202]
MPRARSSPAAPAAPLPIDGLLGAIETALSPPGSTLLLQAPPGAGKTTRVPLALMHALPAQGIVMLEPRRLATRAAAERLASSLGEAVGEQVGYRVRLESRCSSRTRLEVVTSGLFLRRLQSDPALEGVGLVIFDEFHERQADADLALALLRQARALLRPDLRVLVMSATLDLEPLAAELDQAQVLTSEGRSHPVSVEHQRPRESEAIERQVLRALEQQWLPQRHAGETALIFLPGLREIQRTQRLLESCPWSQQVAICPLHGSLPLEAQRQAIAPADPDGAKLVLATSIAESSLTIEGVRLVIDAGWSRRSRFDPATGMDGLVTVPASQASAEQRRGRAGRLGPGHCLRLWSPAEQQRRPAFDPPELLEVDPLPIALQLAQWGAGLGEDLAWLTPPPLAGLQEARRLLEQLGALDQSGALSDHGRALSAVGLHPRLAHLLLKASGAGDLDLACDLAVLLSERDPLDRQEHGSDLLRRLAWMRPQGQGRRGSGPQQRLHQLAAELRRQVRAAAAPPSGADPGPADLEWRAARLITWAYPERIALRRPGSPHRYQLRSGRGATLHPSDPLVLAEALAVAVLDGQGQDAAIRLAVPLPAALLEELAVDQGVSVEEVRWDNTAQRVRCERSLRLGALVLERSPWPEADEDRIRQALLEGLRQRGLEALPWGARSRQLQQRLLLAHQHLGSPWPDCSDQALSQTLEDWLGRHLQGVRSLEDLQRLDLCEVLWADLDWTQRRLLDDWLPQQLTVPSGRRIHLTYQNGEAVLAVKLQEMFGCRQTPTLLQGRLPVTVHLLSPAGRPAAITRDLSGFWDQGYAEVRRDLRGRYPRHPWPEDPRQAQATAHTKARLAREQAARPAPQG